MRTLDALLRAPEPARPGTLVEWKPLTDGTPALRWHSGSDALGVYSHPIACCR